MSRLIKIFTFLFLTCLTSCQTQSQVYTDLNDYGYKGKIKSVSTKFYSNINQKNDIWEIEDSLNPRTTIINYFNEDGNFTKKVVASKTHSYQLVFEYSGKNKNGWKKIDPNGIIIEIGKFTYNGKTGFTETVFDTIQKKKFQSIYTFSKNQRTKTLEDKGYNDDGSLNFNSFSTFEDDNQGHLYKLITQNKLNNSTEYFEFVIIEEDKFNNPLKILLKRNEKPIEIRKVNITYK